MENTKSVLASLPHSPGIYIYKDSAGKVLYVGKAVDLKKRVSQYFQRDDAIGEKTKLLVSKIKKVETIKTANEFDALLLEARLIHDLKPHFNSISKDDKSPIYIRVTIDEELPEVQLVRKKNLPEESAHAGPAIFGPFQSSRVTRELLRRCRRIIPFCTQKERNGKPCFYTHLHLCNPCPSVIAKMSGPTRLVLVREYRRNILRLKALLSGKATSIKRELEKEMQAAARQNLFEEAQIIKHQLQSLGIIESARFDPSLYLSHAQLTEDVNENELSELHKILSYYYPRLAGLNRIECIDISNLSGSLSTGSVVVLTNGTVDTGSYRKFRIRRKEAPNDTAMISEVVSRRLKHTEWPMPDLLVIDGGKGQVSAAQRALNSLDVNVPVIGLAKRFEEIVVPVTGNMSFKIIRLPLTNPAIHLLQRIRNEAHRFARNYHILLRSKKLF